MDIVIEQAYVLHERDDVGDVLGPTTACRETARCDMNMEMTMTAARQRSRLRDHETDRVRVRLEGA